MDDDDDDDDGDDDDCLAFWHRNESSPNKLVYPALRALSIAVDSSAVERVFVQGAVTLSPNRDWVTGLVMYCMQQMSVFAIHGVFHFCLLNLRKKLTLCHVLCNLMPIIYWYW